MSRTEALRCAVGNHEWTRPVTRGKKPTHCPDHLWVKFGLADPSGAAQEPSGPKEPVTSPAEKRQLKVEASKSRVIETELEHLLVESETIDERIEHAEEAYTVALTNTRLAVDEDSHEAVRKINLAFDKADKAQNRLMSLCARKRFIDSKLEKATA